MRDVFHAVDRYWQLDITQLKGGKDIWDKAVTDASEEYKGHMVMTTVEI